MGGVWEWTSSALEKHNGFKPLELYPGYTGLQLHKGYFVEIGHANSGQPTSLTVNIISFSAGRGPLTLELRAGRHCESHRRLGLKPADCVVSIGTSATTVLLGHVPAWFMMFESRQRFHVKKAGKKLHHNTILFLFLLSLARAPILSQPIYLDFIILDNFCPFYIALLRTCESSDSENSRFGTFLTLYLNGRFFFINTTPMNQYTALSCRQLGKLVLPPFFSFWWSTQISTNANYTSSAPNLAFETS